MAPEEFQENADSEGRAAGYGAEAPPSAWEVKFLQLAHNLAGDLSLRRAEEDDA